MDDYLTKPVDPESLRAALDRWIDARQAAAA
jgi:CheY-like chemotaxis protein